MSGLGRSKRYVSHDNLVIYTRSYRRYQQKLTVGGTADALHNKTLRMLTTVRKPVVKASALIGRVNTAACVCVAWHPSFAWGILVSERALLLVTRVPAVTTQGSSHLQHLRFSINQLAFT